MNKLLKSAFCVLFCLTCIAGAYAKEDQVSKGVVYGKYEVINDTKMGLAWGVRDAKTKFWTVAPYDYDVKDGKLWIQNCNLLTQGVYEGYMWVFGVRYSVNKDTGKSSEVSGHSWFRITEKGRLEEIVPLGKYESVAYREPDPNIPLFECFKDGHYDLINGEGKVIVTGASALSSVVWPDGTNYNLAQWEDGNWSLYDNAGNRLLGAYDTVYPLKGRDKLKACRNGLWSIVELDGTVVVPPAYKEDELEAAWQRRPAESYAYFLEGKKDSLILSKGRDESWEAFEERKASPEKQNAYVFNDFLRRQTARGTSFSLGSYDRRGGYFTVYNQDTPRNSYKLIVRPSEADDFAAAFDSMKAAAEQTITWDVRNDGLCVRRAVFVTPSGHEHLLVH